MADLVSGIAKVFFGLFVPWALTLWALLGNDGIRTVRRVLREDAKRRRDG